jgi:hypothetical protein
VGPGWQQQRCCEGVGEKYFCCQKMQIFINKTHLFSVPFAFPAARMSMGAVGWGGAAVWSTAAEVPSHERVDANVEMLRLMARDRNRYNGCSDGASAAVSGLGGGQKGAGGFSP